jgi:histidinol-phosphatase (PHP family)
MDRICEMILEDLHIHTKFSKDSKEEPEKYIVLAIERGIKYLGFSEHIDLDPTDKDYGYYKYEDAFSSYNFLKNKYEDNLKLFFSTEVTYQNGLEKSIEVSLSGKPYDYIIGSIHRLEGITFSGAHGMPFFKGKDENHSYNMYFDELYSMISTDFFQVVGHFDIIKRHGISIYGGFRAEKYRGKIEKILDKIIKKGMVIEINSSGFRFGLGEQYPSNDIIEMYRNLGGKEITLGSDAHNVSNFGAYLESAIKNALSIFNFDVVTFKNKKKITVAKLSEFINSKKATEVHNA